MSEGKPRILFVCVQNSCRSQMAEGFARALGAGSLEAFSAGSKPSGEVNETAELLMGERGIDISSQRSKGLSDLPAVEWDCVVGMGCGDACPTLPAKARLEWDIPDPKGLSIDEFRKVRDLVEAKVRELVRSLPC